MDFIKHSKGLSNGRRISVAAHVRMSENGPEMTFGLAICKPGDVFVKRQARNKSYGRAISHSPALVIQLPAADRTPARIRAVYYQYADQLIAAKNEELDLREEAGKHVGKSIAR